MTGFDPQAAVALGGPSWLVERRAAAAARLDGLALPAEAEEVWRYSGIDHFSLDGFGLGPVPERAPASVDVDALRALADGFGPRAALVVTVNGTVVLHESDTGGQGTVGVSGAGPLSSAEAFEAPDAGEDASEVEDGAFGVLHDAFVSDIVGVRADKGASLQGVVVVHVIDPTLAVGSPSVSAFPHLWVDVEQAAQASVLELFVPAAGPGIDASAAALVVPRTELRVGDGAQLSYTSLQVLGTGAVCIAGQRSTVGRDATFRSFSVGFGGGYARVRTDSDLVGQGGHSSLLAAYLGTGTQVHDFRTLQDHHAPRTDSELLFTGAVADTARSVYSGLIRIRHGARRSDARQTNHNLVLSEGAHADSVPNLDIDENDVRCSHASTVGPIDEDQRYYLESRGVEPSDAERLIVLGFFRAMAARAAHPGVTEFVERHVSARLAGRALHEALS